MSISPGWEWLILLAVALLLFGGSRLGGVESTFGRRGADQYPPPETDPTPDEDGGVESADRV